MVLVLRQHRPKRLLQPLYSKAFGGHLVVVRQAHPIREQFRQHVTRGGQLPGGIERETLALGEGIQHQIARPHIPCQAPSVPFQADVGEPAEVQACCILTEEQGIGHGHKGCALSAEGYIQTAQITDDRHARTKCSVQFRAASQLSGVSVRRLMKNGLPGEGDHVKLLGVRAPGNLGRTPA